MKIVENVSITLQDLKGLGEHFSPPLDGFPVVASVVRHHLVHAVAPVHGKIVGMDGLWFLHSCWATSLPLLHINLGDKK